MQYNSISSSKNSIVGQLLELKTSAKARSGSGTMLLEGLRLCGDAAACGTIIKRVLVTEVALERYGDRLKELLSLAESVYIISDRVASSIGDTNTPQGVFAEVALPTLGTVDKLDSRGVYFLLDTVQDPGNVGTILRTAEGLGLSGVILSAGCADVFSSKVIRASMGSVLRLPVLVDMDLPNTIDCMRDSGMNIFAARLDESAVPIDKLSKSGGLGIVLGNEGSGVSEAVYSHCSGSVSIPMSSSIESFNVAVSAAIVAWELRRV